MLAQAWNWGSDIDHICWAYAERFFDRAAGPEAELAGDAGEETGDTVHGLFHQSLGFKIR